MGYDDEQRNFGIEALFLGGMAVLVFGIALFAAMTTSFGRSPDSNANNNSHGGTSTVAVSQPGTVTSTVNAQGQRDVVCACYNEGFELASRTNDVQSTTYRTGFSQCRALGGVDGGNAWTAGWDARQSGRTYEATCKAYKRRGR